MCRRFSGTINRQQRTHRSTGIGVGARFRAHPRVLEHAGVRDRVSAATSFPVNPKTIVRDNIVTRSCARPSETIGERGKPSGVASAPRFDARLAIAVANLVAGAGAVWRRVPIATIARSVVFAPLEPSERQPAPEPEREEIPVKKPAPKKPASAKTTKKADAKKPAPKKATKKSDEKKPAPKKTDSKAAEKKDDKKKAAPKKTTKKADEKKPAPKKTGSISAEKKDDKKKAASKKTTKKADKDNASSKK